MPISRVRSLTAISMMFMITMPPTTSEMRHQAREREEQDPGDLLPGAQRALRGLESKLFSCAGLELPRGCASRASASAMAALHLRRDRRCRTMSASRMLIGQISRRAGALNGMIANLSSESPNSVPCLAPPRR